MLKQIGEIKLGDITVHVARNGEYQLVAQDGEDAYETPIYRVYDLSCLKPGELLDVCKDLVQVVGRLLTEKQAVADSRRAALQGTKSEE